MTIFKKIHSIDLEESSLSQAKIELIGISHDELQEPTDKYCIKRMLEKTIDYGFCPNCKVPLMYKDDTHKVLICPNDCGFEKSSEIPEDFHKLEPMEDWVVRKKKEQAKRS